MAKKAKAAVAANDDRATVPKRRLRDRVPVRYLAPIAKLAEEQPMALIGGGTLVLGVVTRRPAMIRNGARMLASQVVAIGARTLAKGDAAPETAVPGRAARTRRGTYASDVVAGAAVGWLTERIAGVAMRAVERLAEDRTLPAEAEAEAEAHPS